MKRKAASPAGQLSLWQDQPVEEPRKVTQAPVILPSVQAVDLDALTIDDLTFFSLARVKHHCAHDLARKRWLLDWSQTADPAFRWLHYSESSGYYSSELWPQTREKLQSFIVNGNNFSVYCLFIHAQGLRLDQCLKDAIARGELGSPATAIDEEDEL
jgi:hypothetical protein